MAYGLSNDLIRDKYFNYYDLCKFENFKAINKLQ